MAKREIVSSDLIVFDPRLAHQQWEGGTNIDIGFVRSPIPPYVRSVEVTLEGEIKDRQPVMREGIKSETPVK